MNKYKRNIVLDYVHIGLRSFNVTSVIWLLFLLLKGFDPLDIGIFESVFHISSMTFEIPSGMVADIIGRKKARIIGVLLYLLYVVLMVYGDNFYIVGLAFIFYGASYSFESGSGEALIYDSLIKTNEQENFIEINGKREIIFQLSSSLALLVGGYLALVQYELNFLVVFIAFAASLIPILMMKETQPKNNEKHDKFSTLMYNHFIKSTKIVVKDKILTFLIIFGSFLAAPVTSVFLYFQIYLSGDLSYFENWIGVLLAAHTLAGALGGFLAPRLEKKYKEKLLLYIVPLFLVLTFWMIQLNSIVFVPFIILGFLDTLIYVILGDYINRLIPSNERATILSFRSFSFSIVMIIIFPIVGAIATYTTFRFSFMILALFLTILYVLLIIFLKLSKLTIQSDK